MSRTSPRTTEISRSLEQPVERGVRSQPATGRQVSLSPELQLLIGEHHVDRFENYGARPLFDSAADPGRVAKLTLALRTEHCESCAHVEGSVRLGQREGERLDDELEDLRNRR